MWVESGFGEIELMFRLNVFSFDSLKQPLHRGLVRLKIHTFSKWFCSFKMQLIRDYLACACNVLGVFSHLTSTKTKKTTRCNNRQARLDIVEDFEQMWQFCMYFLWYHCFAFIDHCPNEQRIDEYSINSVIRNGNIRVFFSLSHFKINAIPLKNDGAHQSRFPFNESVYQPHILSLICLFYARMLLYCVH